MTQSNIEKNNSAGRRVAAGTGKAASWLFRLLAKTVLVLLFAAAGFFIGGFLQFATAVSNADIPTIEEPADGIVALTGGSARIAHALDLLQARKAKRLLISGVNPITSSKDIERINPEHHDLFECCVDIERQALDTIGNAEETAKWVKSNGYESIILVTSAYHMPRSLVEFRRRVIGTRIVSHPVPLKELSTDGWWYNPETLRFMLSEYLKYLGARSGDYVQPHTLQSLRANVLGG